MLIHAATEHLNQPHRIELFWNGQSLGTFDTFGRQRHTLSVTLAGAGAAADNELRILQHATGEAPPAIYVDAVEVDYPRLAVADAPLFRFGAAEQGATSVVGLQAATVHLYEISSDRTPAYYGEHSVNVGGGLSFDAGGADRHFLAAASQVVTRPSAILQNQQASLRSIEHEVDYLIIAASHLVEDSEALARHREADGYRTMVVDVDDVYWEFAQGEPDPLAIREFLAMWDAPIGWLTFVGHGGLDRLAKQGLLTSADVPALSEASGAPVVIGWTCNIARHDIPGFFALGEELVTRGASAGVFSATGWSNHFDTDVLRTAFTEAAFASDAETIGEAMLAAHRAASDAPLALHRVYMLLGDPALRLREPKAGPDPEPSPGPTPTQPPAEPPAQEDATVDASGSGCHAARLGSGPGPIGSVPLMLALLLLFRSRRRQKNQTPDRASTMPC